MAKHMREYFTCDRCGIEIDRPDYGGDAGTFSLRVHAGFATCGEVICWDELCRECNIAASKVIDVMKADQRQAREDVEGGE